MSILECYKSGWVKTFNYSSLTNRKEYWSFILINSFIAGLFGLMSDTLGVIFAMLILLPSCSAGYRRLSDAGMEGRRFITLYVLVFLLCVFVALDFSNWLVGVFSTYVAIKALICFIGTLCPSQDTHFSESHPQSKVVINNSNVGHSFISDVEFEELPNESASDKTLERKINKEGIAQVVGSLSDFAKKQQKSKVQNNVNQVVNKTNLCESAKVSNKDGVASRSICKSCIHSMCFSDGTLICKLTYTKSNSIICDDYKQK